MDTLLLCLAVCGAAFLSGLAMQLLVNAFFWILDIVPRLLRLGSSALFFR